METTVVEQQQQNFKNPVVHLHNGILYSRKKERLLFMTAWLVLATIMLSEISQVVKDKYHTISAIRGT